MVETRKFSEVLRRGLVVGSGGILCAMKVSEIFQSPANVNACSPGTPATSNTLETGGILASLMHVGKVVRDGAWSKVRATVIQSVAVFVIYVRRVARKNGAVHGYFDALPVNAYASPRVKGVCISVPTSAPIPLHQKFAFRSIHHCDFALREWNKFYRLIGRLNNRLAVNATFGHDSTSNGIAVFDRFCIVA